MNLEAIAMRRRDEMLARGAWKKPDDGEGNSPVLCLRCSAPVTRSTAGVCHACSRLGYRGTPCIACGGVTHKRDRANRMALMYGMCGECRRKSNAASTALSGWEL